MTPNNLAEHMEILTKHNHWRRCNDENCGCTMVDVKKLGLAIDAAIEVMQAPKPPIIPDGYIFNIVVEKLLCEKLGRAWSPNCSIVSLINELAPKPPIVDDDAVAIWKAGYPPKDGKNYSAYFKTGDPMHHLRGQYTTVIFWSGFDWYDRIHGTILTEPPDFWMPLQMPL